ncbi:MAG: phospholipid/cholesterol/gamma-HCH transport system substrate-binding protein [Nocardioidaceae bacterium]|jgi:phospholipid/cholesterol/gamma-HCH transport system substrate-binding protein|nr:phospholipid/cholesterol/gamma-HCH transport system substrate-binding protein [Nocardioidaceae bacterium]
MKQIDRESMSALVKLGFFFAITGIATLILALTLSNGSFGSRTTYKAMFSDATGVTKGDDVRIAGVAVGSVKNVKIVDRNKALVTFGVDSKVPLTANTHVTIKFRNLVGQRYMALTQGAEGAKSVLKKDAVIPESRTTEALDLNVLLKGFKPVFQALSPGDTNKFAYEIVQTLQGESGNVENLLARTSSLTNTLAGRDKLIGDVIDNLSEVLDTVGSRDKELDDTIDTLQQFVTGLKDDRNAILNSVDSISDLTDETSDLLVQGRPALSEDITQLNALTKNLSKPKNLATVQNSLRIFPIKLKKLGNLASSGSEFNFYLCDLKGSITIPEVKVGTTVLLPETTLQLSGPTGLHVGGERCDQPGYTQ